MIDAYRLHSSRYPANSGKGAAIRGGRSSASLPDRWSSGGIPADAAVEVLSKATIEAAHSHAPPVNNSHTSDRSVFAVAPLARLMYALGHSFLSAHCKEPFGAGA